MNFGKVLRFGLAALTVVFLWAVAASPVLAQEAKPNVVFILADNVGYGDLGPTAGVSCAVRRRHGSTGLPARDSG